MRLKCILSIYAFSLFWGTILLFLPPSLLIYFLVYPWRRYPQDVFQYLSSVIFKIFFKLLYVTDLELRVEGELLDGAIYIATHQSSLDYPILGSFIKRYLTITNVNFTKYPLMSYVSRLIGVRGISKQHTLGEVASVYSELEEVLNENRNVIIFPEGTRDDGKKLKRFKKGAFRLAMQTRKPIVPIVIDGSAKILAKGDPCFKTTKRTKVTVTVLPAIYPQDFENETQMLEYAANMMQYDRHKK